MKCLAVLHSMLGKIERICILTLESGAMEKFDFKKQYAPLWRASHKEPVFITVPALPYIMVNGKGDPNTSGIFQQAIEALYGTAYSIKFSLKKDPSVPRDFSISALEGLWWMNDGSEFSLQKKDEWMWTLMVMMPPFVNQEHVDKAKNSVKAKKDNPIIDQLRFELFEEGDCAQILHIGPYSEEEPTIQKLTAFINVNEKNFRGKHHEIYLGDPRRSSPEKLRTIIRHPIE